MAELRTGGKYDEFIGELWPGAEGWLPLSDTGKPIGPATLEPPTDGWAAPVFATFAPQPAGIPMLATPSGADIDDHMLPRHDFRFPKEESPESVQARKEVWANKKAHWEKYYKPRYRTT